MMHIVGKQMPRVILGQTTILEHLLKDGLLNEYYSTALGISQATEWLQCTVHQITQRYPNMRILEIGKDPILKNVG